MNSSNNKHSQHNLLTTDAHHYTVAAVALLNVFVLGIFSWLILAGTAFPSPAYAAQFDDEHYKAAESFLTVAYPREIHKQRLEIATDQFLKAQPQLTAFRKTIREFFDYYIGYETFVYDDMAHAWAIYLTTDELNDLREFYSTATGKKVAGLTLKLDQQIEQYVTDRITKNIGYLKEMINVEAERLNRLQG